jgi:serine/threonine protein kinase
VLKPLLVLPVESPKNPASPASGADSPRQSAELVPGQKVGGGRYTLIRFLGKGGMGVVWLAKDERLAEEVALKFLAGEIAHNVEALEAMRRETKKSRKLSHPNIIRIHDLFEGVGEAPFISMEFIEGLPLNTLKARQPKKLFSWAEARPLVQQLCEALDYAHAQKVIHRDLKPANVMVTGAGVLKLADFGIAATLSETRNRLSQDVGSSGTPAYMSPQQMNGGVPRVADDMYALGATLYELLTSKLPFHSGDIYHQVQNQPAAPLDKRLAELGLANEIPADVSAMVMACLSKDPEQRPPTARAIAEWIGLSIHSPPPKRFDFADLARPEWRNKLIAAAVVFFIMALGATWRFWDSSDFTPAIDFKLEEGWVPIYGKGVLGYGANDVSLWRRIPPEGTLVGTGNKKGVVWEKDPHANFEFKAEAWLETGGSGSILLRGTLRKNKDASAYTVLLNNSPPGPLRTGTVTDLAEVRDTAAKDRAWFEIHTILIGNRIVVRINQRTVADCRDPRTEYYRSGVIGLVHKAGPLVMYRRLRVHRLPADEAAALKEVGLPPLP